VPLFEKLARVPGIHSRVLHGADLPGTKVRNAPDLGALDHRELPTLSRRVAGRHLVWHRGLRRALMDFRPDVILAEGESNFPNYLQVLRYARSNPSVRTIHWSLGGLPGRGSGGGPREALRSALRRRFDRYLVYSSFGRRCLVDQGIDPALVSVAVNTSDSERHMRAADTFELTPEEARRSLGLAEAFTVLYCGSFELPKRPDVLLDLARSPELEGIQFVGIGDGPLRGPLYDAVTEGGLENLHLPGRVGPELPAYYRAADVLIVPGRGGMVISEAMAWSLPVLVHEADGTEYDLVEDRSSGARVASVAEFGPSIRRLAREPALAKEWGRTGRSRLEAAFTTEHMVDAIVRAVRDA
jgi:glycosyltransferase involved in cell wall biosynthesis